MNSEEFLSIKEFASLMKVHENTIRKGIKSGKIAAIRLTSSPKSAYRIPRTQIQTLSFQHLEEVIGKIIEKTPLGEKKTWGYVYIIETEDGNIKIGKSKAPSKRINSIESSLNIKICKTFVSYKHENFSETEVRLHEKYRMKRISGEWFSVDFEEAKKSLQQLTEIK